MKKIIFILLTLFAAFTMFAKNANGEGNGKTAKSKPPKTTTEKKDSPPIKVNSKMDTSKYVVISTDYGDIRIRLYDETPLHRDNFVKLAKQGFFDSTLFHRIIPSFMIQGGDPDSKKAAAGQPLGSGDVGYRVPAEFNKNLIHKRGVLAAARDGNPQKASSGCQFYITQGRKYSEEELQQFISRKGNIWTEDQKKIYKEIGGTPMLDQDYTVFGEVVSGIETVDKILQEPRDGNDRPYKDIRMKVRVEE
ncbi:MAG: peptidylprolyl isomerase [Bacteroidota bacterium]|nr:peptidylprolyl isomerase [Bacteroidota bacterium]